jgi:hypothetical protein
MITFSITSVTILLLGILWGTNRAGDVIFKWLLYAIAFYCIGQLVINGKNITEASSYIFMAWVTVILSIIWSSKGKLNIAFKIALILEAVFLFLKLI